MWIKICGINDLETAQRVAELQPNAIGLNFYEQTPRVVAVDVAARIVEELQDDIEPVGLFVNHSAAEIRRICTECQLRTIQLHGDEPPELIAELNEFTVIRAFRVGGEGLAEMADYLDACTRLQATPEYSLVDARVPGTYGGSGQTVSWEMLSQEYQTDNWPPLIVSGGLTPQNIAEAIHRCHPWGVDVSSGVEKTKAVKDLSLVSEFINSARRAFAEKGE